MINFSRSAHFDRAVVKFVKNNRMRLQATNKVLGLFKDNPKHPSLNLEKLGGSTIWTIRVDKGNRIFFTWQDEHTAILLDIGSHDKYKLY